MISLVQPVSSLAVGIARDVVRSRTELVAENAFLRQQLIVLQRHVPHPRFRAGERVTLVLFARLARGWRSALLLVQPATILRWHREMFRKFWMRFPVGLGQSSEITRPGFRQHSASVPKPLGHGSDRTRPGFREHSASGAGDSLTA